MMFLTIRFSRNVERPTGNWVTGNRTDQEFHEALREVVNMGYQEVGYQEVGYQEVEIAWGGLRNRWNECERFAGVA